MASPLPMRLLGLWHLTSLDAPTVAITWCLAFAFAARVQLPLWLPVVLGLAAWVFYVGDRLLDAHRAFRGKRTEGRVQTLQARHVFHWKHRRFFLPLAIAAAIIGLGLVVHDMPMAARQRNTLLAVASLAYFSSVHAPSHFPLPRLRLKLRLPKELLVGLIFTLACALPAWSRLSASRLVFLPVFLVFASLAWLNCHAIEVWESDLCRVQRPKGVQVLSILLGAVALSLAGVEMLLHSPRLAALMSTAAISSGAIAVLNRCPKRVDQISLRAAADLVLLTPLLLFL